MGPLFDSLERLDKLLADRKFVAGTDNISEADVRLYTTIVRPVALLRAAEGVS